MPKEIAGGFGDKLSQTLSQGGKKPNPSPGQLDRKALNEALDYFVDVQIKALRQQIRRLQDKNPAMELSPGTKRTQPDRKLLTELQRVDNDLVKEI